MSKIDNRFHLSEEGKKMVALFISMKYDYQFCQFERWILKRSRKIIEIKK